MAYEEREGNGEQEEDVEKTVVCEMLDARLSIATPIDRLPTTVVLLVPPSTALSVHSSYIVADRSKQTNNFCKTIPTLGILNDCEFILSH